MKRTDLVLGAVIGRWTVAGPECRVRKMPMVPCRCSCGTQRLVGVYGLLKGQSLSCGCYQRDRVSQLLTTHGHSSRRGPSPEYRAWAGMVGRCYRPSQSCYERYGGRGIRVCDRWRDSFAAFLEDMGPRPTALHTLDRTDNDGDYAPGNCRWATREEQGANTRRTIRITWRGKTQTLVEWARETGLPYLYLYHRRALGLVGDELFTLKHSRKT